MQQSFKKIMAGYHAFRNKYATGDDSIMSKLADRGQNPKIMIVGCSDSRVDPALILQSNPGELFIARNVANIVPPFKKDVSYRGTCAALEYGICSLEVKHLIILGHSQCGGIKALFDNDVAYKNDFVSNWVSLVSADIANVSSPDQLGKQALLCSYENCLTFPWIKERVEKQQLAIHLWFFDIKQGEIQAYSFADQSFQILQ